MEKAYALGTYSVEIEYDYYESVETMTMEEYEAAYNTFYGNDNDYEALEKYYSLQENVEVLFSIYIDIYYDVDYIYVEEYLEEDGSYTLGLLDIVVNAEDGLWEYFTYDNYQWYYYPSYMNALDGIYEWEDYYGSLFDIYESGTLDHLYYDSTYGIYDFDDWRYNYYYGYLSAYSADWFVGLGGDWLFGDYAYTYSYYYDIYYYTLFYEAYQMLTSYYYYGYMDYTDETYEEFYYGGEDIYFTVYDVGSTDKRDTVDYYHNYWQSIL